MILKKKGFKHVAILLVAFVFMSTILGALSVSVEAAQRKSNRKNVVFVMDDSGSMQKTDKEQLRYEAMELFLGLAVDEGNYMGAVVFNDDIIQLNPITEMNGKEVRKDLMSNVRSAKVHGDTDIGKAIYTATDMINQDGNSSLDSAIILLSDGKTDLKSADALSQSEQLKQQAIESARNQGIKVYGICLNANGEASYEEVKQISDATGGKSKEVKSAADLKDVFELFYELIYDEAPIILPVPDPDENGNLNVEFEIPDIGVEEANIIINTLNPNVSYGLWKPDGMGFSDQELEDMEIRAKTFIVIKIPFPEGGMWKLQVSGVSRDEVEIQMLCNSNLQIDLSNKEGKDTVPMNGGLNWVATFDSSTPGAAADAYQKYPLYVDFIDANGNVRTEPMTAGSSEAVLADPMSSVGEYDVIAYTELGGKRRTSNTVHVSVTNSAPKAEDFVVKKVKFIGTKPAEIDLTDHVTDAEDSVLTYSVEQSELEADTVDVNGEVLTVDVAKSGSGEVLLKAIDSAGESVQFIAKVKVFNLLILLLIILLLIVVLVVVIIILAKAKKSNKRINGSLEIMIHNEMGDSEIETVIGNKGTMNIGREVMSIGNIRTGIDLNKCTIRAGKRDSELIFASKIPFFTESGDKKKEITLINGAYTNIYADLDNRENGVNLCFKAEQMGGFGGDFGMSGDGSFGGW